MSQTVDARDILDANARTRRPFRARVLGHFRRIGPNSWDPYRFVKSDEEREIEVFPGLKVQVEEFGAVFRIRSEGKVLRAEWLGSDAEDAEEAGDDGRSVFMQGDVTRYRNTPGRGLKAVIAKKLRKRR